MFDEQRRYLDYAELLLIHYPHWRPSDVKEMTPRERTYWLRMGQWMAERRKIRVPYAT